MKLGLGTVQFGTDYGISNLNGKTPPGEIKAILQVAQENGISVIDTAHSYGDSEHILGEVLANQNSFRIITKTPVYKKKKIGSRDAENMKVSFHNSLKKLRQSKLAGLLIHNAEDLLTNGGDILFYAMQELKKDKLVEKIGASVYSGEQIDCLLERYDFDLIQVPVNVLDQRLIYNGYLTKLKGQGIEIHARSVFLQGLLLMSPASLPSFFNPIKPLLCGYYEFLRSQTLTPIEGAIGFIKQIPEVDCIIIGVNDVEQLKSNLKSFTRLYHDSLFKDFKTFSLDNPKYLNPSLWRLN
ncbi:MAG: aldo/keto reductase [Candidatus Brocadia sp.]|jgi:aryl-alcohol dehydrogenase-like predicted oxidoreductase